MINIITFMLTAHSSAHQLERNQIIKVYALGLGVLMSESDLRPHIISSHFWQSLVLHSAIY